MQPTFHIHADSASVARAFADHLADRIKQQNEDFHLALSGGSTPKLLFQLLAEEYRDTIDWNRLHLYWGDERMVPHDHPESNYGEVKKLLLTYIDMPDQNVHPVPTAIPADKAAEAYGMVIQQCMAAHGKSPVFDLIMLGMGDDGHTASIFPHQMELLENNAICGVATHPESGQRRVTLNGPVINAAKEVAFLVTGAKKTSRVAQILNKAEGWEAFPAAHIQPKEGELGWWLDEAAAKEIQ